MGLATAVLHNICLELGDTVASSMDLTVDTATNKRRDKEKVVAILDTDRNQRNYTGDKTANAITECLTAFLGGEKQGRN